MGAPVSHGRLARGALPEFTIMTRPSNDDLPATPAELLAIAAAHGLSLTAGDEFDDTGLDFRVLHARDAEGTAWIVRTPRRPDVYASTLVEARVLALVGPRLPVAVPDWRVHAPNIIAYPRIVGTPVVSVGASGPEWHILDREAPSPVFLDSFARALAALQAIAPAGEVPVTTIAAVRRELGETMLATRDALGPPEALWGRWQRWLADDSLWPEHVALVHGDLHPGHMLLAEDATVVGVLDWTEACFSDPSIDLAMFHGCFGAGALAELLPRFVAAGGRAWPGLRAHAAERWAAFPALAAAWALRTDNAAILEYARGQMATIE